MADDRKIPVIKYNNVPEQNEIKSRWWLQKEDEVHRHVFGVVNKIREFQAYRSMNNLRYARLYANMDLVGLQAGLFARINDPTQFLNNLISFNVVKACIDTAESKIAKAKPRPMFMTDDGDWMLQRRAQLLTAFFEGLFDTMGTGAGDNRTLYGIARRNWRDGAIFGTGATKFYADPYERTVKAERIMIEEIVVDDMEGMYEQPRQLHQEKMVFREVLCDMFPEYADKIMVARSMIPVNSYESQTSADMIKVIESWHIPSGPEAKDGKRAISIDGCTLEFADWNKSYFPFVFQRWQPRILGFYGQGLCEELLPIQLEINKLLRTIAISQHLMSAPQVWLDIQNQAVPRKISNQIGGIQYYVGQPPIFMAPTSMNAEIYQHLENLYNKAFAITGVSQMAASAQKPSGLNAAVALREWQDIESDRFQLSGMRYQDYFIEAAYMAMDMLNDLEQDGGKSPKVRVSEGDGSKEISWKQVKIDKEKLKIRAFPTDLLPSTPAGKLQTAQEMMQAGFFDREESLELLDFPDIRSVTGLKTANRAETRKMIERIIDSGEYETPEPYIDLQMARNLSQAYYLRGKARGLAEDRLELLRRFMDDCQAMLSPPSPPADLSLPQGADAGAALAGDQAGAQAASAGAPPIASPVAPPTSQLLPQG